MFDHTYPYSPIPFEARQIRYKEMLDLGRSVARESLRAVITLVGISRHCTVVVYIVTYCFCFFISCEFNLISYYSRKNHGLTLFCFCFVFSLRGNLCYEMD